jgi:hypothetical protein
LPGEPLVEHTNHPTGGMQITSGNQDAGIPLPPGLNVGPESLQAYLEADAEAGQVAAVNFLKAIHDDALEVLAPLLGMAGAPRNMIHDRVAAIVSDEAALMADIARLQGDKRHPRGRR